jgi:hypothetical protein
MSNKDNDTKLSPEEVAAHLKDPNLKIVFAQQDAVDDVGLNSYTNHIMAVIKAEMGIRGAWISDESCFSDFAMDAAELVALGTKLGVVLDPTNDADWYIVRVAARLKALKGTEE